METSWRLMATVKVNKETDHDGHEGGDRTKPSCALHEGTDADEGGQHETSDPKRPVFRNGDLAGLSEPEDDRDDGEPQSDESEGGAQFLVFGCHGVPPSLMGFDRVDASNTSK